MAASETSSTLIGALWSVDSRASRLGKFVRLAVLAVAGTALLAISAQISVPMWPVPMTMQTFAVVLIGAAYGWRLGGATVALYLAEGAMGLPVFANGGSLASLAGPTAGYLFAFVAAAALVGALIEKGWGRSLLKTALAMTLGTAVIFAGGIAWLSTFTGVEKALVVGMYPFLPGAVFKIALAVAVLPMAWKLIGKLRK
ncbi:biotin transporter BioY [Sneathiella chungangensis]|uniref:Biotin transporter n=1 Tax=Sneathiella chungangensis TaxID=1418234 RepID=A0A845MC16_9PROT|nr:biotin transporter BioY [Sneathiella chungangensis]MZR21548.1 biotin transporter BioY [Sneathiella chungangensis]